MDTPTEQSAWSRTNEQDEAMAAMESDLGDLSNLFEFGDIALNNLSQVDDSQYDVVSRPLSTTLFDDIADAPTMRSSPHDVDFQRSYEQYDASQNVNLLHPGHYDGTGTISQSYPPEAMYQPSMHSTYQANHPFPFQGQPGYPPNQYVPPTPNSFKMHGETGSFVPSRMDLQNRSLLEQRYQLREEDAIAFTPMASPAGTPQYNVHLEYTTTPGAYFSPLTSPMLHAENVSNTQQLPPPGYYTNSSTAPSSDSTSPLDTSTNVDMMGDHVHLPESTAGQTRKSSRKKQTTPRGAARPLIRVKQSPIQKAVKRKSGTMLSSMVPSQDMEAILDAQRPAITQPVSGGLRLPHDSSENGSISPEPLNEAPMGPPPRPGSRLLQSPSLAGQSQDSGTSTTGQAATPKSLLSTRGVQASGSAQNTKSRSSDELREVVAFEELQLPEAADQRILVDTPSVAQVNTNIPITTSSEISTPVSASKTPKLGPLSTPSSTRPASALASPSSVAASTPGTLLKNSRSDAKAGRTNRKRGSTSASGSTLVSPAIRPRISPSIKPLLPDGASLHSPTHALLLASKSNYQNLLEGNHLPGVNYPDSLSTGLTSKRTSHKVAEQGRRNRINEALKEMQALLPKSASSKGGPKESSMSDASPDAEPEFDGRTDKDESQSKNNNSKAATVESANEYIRKLQIENAALLAFKAEHEATKKTPEARTGVSSENCASTVEASSSEPS